MPAGDAVESKPRSRFKKPAWLEKKQAAAAVSKKPSTEPKRDAVDIFSRSADTHAQIVAEQQERERRLKEKKERKQREQKEKERERQLRLLDKTFKSVAEDSPQVENRDSKRRRISTPSEDLADTHFASPSHSPPPSHGLYVGASRPAPIFVDLSDHEVDQNAVPSPHSRSAVRSQSIQEPSIIEPDRAIEPHEPATANEMPLNAEYPPPIPVDQGPNPVITILIAPDIPDTRPLIVQRKYRQNLRDVRLAWCDYNGLDEGMKTTVILTWRDRRLFDVHNCKSLGIPLDRYGAPYITNEDKIQEPLERLALVATTKQIMEEAKKKAAEEAAAAKRAKALQFEIPTAPTIRAFKVVLRSKGLPDKKLIIKEDTLIERVGNAFRQHHDIPEDRLITLYFDGDDLNPSDVVKDTEMIEDYDGEAILLDVHVK